MKEIADSKKLRSEHGNAFRIKGMVAAYDQATKEARIYMELDEVYERVVLLHMTGVGATSVSVDTFSSSDWEQASRAAYDSVCEWGVLGDNPCRIFFREGALAVAGEFERPEGEGAALVSADMLRSPCIIPG